MHDRLGFLLILFIWQFCPAQSLDEDQGADICRTAGFLPVPENQKCSTCLRVPNGKCAWCSHPNYDNGNNNFRCDLKENHLKNSCAKEYITAPESVVDINQDTPLRNAGDNGVEPIQLQPQGYKIKLRVGETASLKIKFRQAIDYPLDLYYLMDLTWSMKDDKDKLTQLADQLAFEMTELTKDFQLGFGSFVDKKIIPFIDPRPKYANMEDCTECVAPYGFHHHMTLTKDTKKFQQLVGQARISGNLDTPEGGLDALVQVLACKDRIGWRDRSRKTIVFSTDASFHFSGDGRLAGLVEPNDGQCHLSDAGYDQSIDQDYASIELLYRLIKQNQANVLFAVTADVKNHYDRLRRALSQDVSAAVGILANDSSNVVELVVNEYKKISQYLTLINTLKGTEGISLSVSAICKNGVFNNSNACTNVQLGETITFNVNVTLNSCDQDSPHTVTFTLGPSGLGESVSIMLEKQCQCECEKETSDKYKIKAAECGGKGNQTCGVCHCELPYAGPTCECDTSVSPGKTTSELDYLCRRDNNPKSQICEGRGYCQCGVCQCQQPQTPGHQIYGKFCECDNFMCARAGGKVCGGNGRCGCDQKCQCHPGWTGSDCTCPISDDSCRSPNGLICNGKGACNCGVCTCMDKEYSGRACEQCSTCPPPCVWYRDCVLYQAFKSGPYNQSDFEQRCLRYSYDYRLVKQLPESHKNIPLAEVCQFVDPKDGCTFYFTYLLLNGTSTILWINDQKDCPLIGTPLAILIGIVAGIVLIGLFLLIAWKLLTMWHDNREYKRFQDEIKNAKWATEQNPIFQSPVNRYQNPMYSASKDNRLIQETQN